MTVGVQPAATAADFRRGDVVTLPLPLVTDASRAKLRPAVVIQNNIGNRASPNLIVAAISTRVPGKRYPMHFLVEAGSPVAAGAGLRKTSVVKAEVIATVPKSVVKDKIGCFPPEVMAGIDACLRVSLAL